MNDHELRQLTGFIKLLNLEATAVVGLMWRFDEVEQAANYASWLLIKVNMERARRGEELYKQPDFLSFDRSLAAY